MSVLIDFRKQPMDQEPVCQECGWLGTVDFKDGKTFLSCDRCGNTWIPAYFKKIDKDSKL